MYVCEFDFFFQLSNSLFFLSSCNFLCFVLFFVVPFCICLFHSCLFLLLYFFLFQPNIKSTDLSFSYLAKRILCCCFFFLSLFLLFFEFFIYLFTISSLEEFTSFSFFLFCRYIYTASFHIYSFRISILFLRFLPFIHFFPQVQLGRRKLHFWRLSLPFIITRLRSSNTGHVSSRQRKRKERKTEGRGDWWIRV